VSLQPNHDVILSSKGETMHNVEFGGALPIPSASGQRCVGRWLTGKTRMDDKKTFTALAVLLVGSAAAEVVPPSHAGQVRGCAADSQTYFAAPAPDTFISHRGESHDAPENTLPAFQMAVERGFGFECDIYLSKDKRVFTFHDGNLRRTTAGACTLACADANWDDVISKCDVGGWGKWEGSKYSPTRPALLEEVLPLARDGRYIYVEVKTGPEIVPYLKEIFAKQTQATPANTLFISFNQKSCAELKKQMPEYKVFWLTGAHQKGQDGQKVPVAPEDIVSTLKRIGADGVDIYFDPSVVDQAFVRVVRDAGYEFHVWTIDNLDMSLRAFAAGAQTVTTNCAKKQLDAFRAR